MFTAVEFCVDIVPRPRLVLAPDAVLVVQVSLSLNGHKT